MIKPLITMGHPSLRKKAKMIEAAEFGGEALKQLIQDLRDTMNDSQGIGIAAPQINVLKQVCIVSLPESSPRYDVSNQPLSGEYIIINPVIKILDKTLSEGMWEGCLSVPGIRGFVKRPKRIQVTFCDEHGNSQKLVLKDMLAIAFQHEIDHLQGKLFVDRVADTRLLSFESNLQ